MNIVVEQDLKKSRFNPCQVRRRTLFEVLPLFKATDKIGVSLLEEDPEYDVWTTGHLDKVMDEQYVKLEEEKIQKY